MMRSWSKPVKVQFTTKPLAETACRWAKPRIAGMGFVGLITVRKKNLIEKVECKEINPPGDTTTFGTGIDLPIR
jgi:hypothetical protein